MIDMRNPDHYGRTHLENLGESGHKPHPPYCRNLINVCVAGTYSVSYWGSKIDSSSPIEFQKI